MPRRIVYRWRLREVMADHGLWKTTDLVPLLADRGITLSASQVYRLVSDPPERFSLSTLAALCDAFGCEPGDLFQPYVVETKRRRQRTAGDVVDLGDAGARPRRARIIDPDET